MNQVRAFNLNATQRRIALSAVILVFVCTELALGFGIATDRPYIALLPLLPLLAFGTMGVMSRLDYGVLSVLVCDLVVRLGLATGTESKIPISLIVTALWLIAWIVNMVINQDVRFICTPINSIIIAFIGSIGLSFVWGRFIIDPQIVFTPGFLNVQLATIAVTVLSVALPLLCLNVVRNVNTVRWSFWLVVVGSVWYLPFYLSNTLFQQVQADGNDLSRLVNAGGLYPMWLCCLTLAVLLNTRNLRRWQRVLLALVLALWVFRLFAVTLVRISGWLPTLIGMLVILFIYSRKWFAGVLCVGTLLIGLNASRVYDAIVVAKAQEGTLVGETSRDSLWSQAFTVSQDHVLFGTGPAGYANYYVTYFADHALSTHNNYLDMLLQYGLTGLLLFVALCLVLIHHIWRAYRFQSPGSFERGFSIGCFGAACAMLPAMLLGDWVIPFAYNQTIAGFDYTSYNWLFIGLALALGRIAREKGGSPPRSVSIS